MVLKLQSGLYQSLEENVSQKSDVFLVFGSLEWLHQTSWLEGACKEVGLAFNLLPVVICT